MMENIMMMSLHRQANLTLKIRADLQATKDPASTLAKRYGIFEVIVAKWKNKMVDDHNYISYRLPTMLWPGNEGVVVSCEKLFCSFRRSASTRVR
ncbi:MAG: hypothetical protein ACTS73_08120 [Arsenophonus sp. NEOnobi-MAG3]